MSIPSHRPTSPVPLQTSPPRPRTVHRRRMPGCCCRCGSCFAPFSCSRSCPTLLQPACQLTTGLPPRINPVFQRGHNFGAAPRPLSPVNLSPPEFRTAKPLCFLAYPAIITKVCKRLRGEQTAETTREIGKPPGEPCKSYRVFTAGIPRDQPGWQFLTTHPTGLLFQTTCITYGVLQMKYPTCEV